MRKNLFIRNSLRMYFFKDKYIVKPDITKKTLTAIAPLEKFVRKSKRFLLPSREAGSLRL